MSKAGYILGREDHDYLNEVGHDHGQMVAMAAEQGWPTTYDPSILPVYDQGQQGACQGHALALAFTVCYYLRTGQIVNFSRAMAYYYSQIIDGIRRDDGSTLSAGRKVAAKGLCLEKEWPYPSRYNPRPPQSNIDRPFSIESSKPVQDVDEAWDFLERGFPIQTGISWTNSMEREVVTDYRYSERSGGHSTLLWGLDDDGDVFNNNSWSEAWQGDGRQTWTKKAFAQMLRGRWNVFIAYMPSGMEYPDLNPIKEVI